VGNGESNGTLFLPCLPGPWDPDKQSKDDEDVEDGYWRKKGLNL